MTQRHRITVVVDGREIEGWTDYSISTSMLNPADSFNLTVPFDRQRYELCAPDRAVRIVCDRTTLITGFIDSRRVSHSRSGGSTISIAGRDKVGRLVQESTGALTFAGQKMSAVISKLVAPWFASVTLSNTRNRKLLRGRGVQVRSNDKIFIDSIFGSRFEPGSTKMSVIEDICEQAGCLAWSSGDGREFVIGTPNYDQEPQFSFQHGPTTNVISFDIEEDVGDRYAKITVIGAGRGDENTWGMAAASRHGIVLDGPNADGTGRDFKYGKHLIVADRYGIKDKADATLRAKREAARRNIRRRAVSVEAPYHGQWLRGAGEVTLFAPDTIAHVQDDETDLRGAYMIVSCDYRSGRGGEVTQLELLPSGTEMTA